MRRSDVGSMTVVTVGLVVVAVTLASTLAVAGGMAVAGARAQGAADASALAAAFEARDRRALGSAYLGADAEPCRVAREVAEMWGGSLTSCAVGVGGVVSVEVAVPAPLKDASATARAGPSSRRCRRPGAVAPGRTKRATRCAGESPVRIPSSNQPGCGAG